MIRFDLRCCCIYLMILSTHLRRSFSLSATHSAAAKQVNQTGEPVLENPKKISSFLGSAAIVIDLHPSKVYVNGSLTEKPANGQNPMTCDHKTSIHTNSVGTWSPCQSESHQRRYLKKSSRPSLFNHASLTLFYSAILWLYFSLILLFFDILWLDYSLTRLVSDCTILWLC